jgi:hypothetical protein
MSEEPSSVDTKPERDTTQPGAGAAGRPSAVQLTSEQIWHELAKGTFAIVSYATPAGDPRSSGVIFKAIGRRLYVVTSPDSWKARHIAVSKRVAVTVPVRRGGILSLVAPIPPATISFHAAAIVHPEDSMDIPEELAPLLPPERRTASCIIEIFPEGAFVTYGIGVSLMKMRNPVTARARVPVD